MEFIGGFINNVMDVKLFLDIDGKGVNLRVRIIMVFSINYS